MGLKEVIKEDLEEVFFNLEEFAEFHEINGKQMLVILDENELTERNATQKVGRHYDGVYTSSLLLYVKAEDYGIRPKVGSVVRIDGKTYSVTEAVDESGVYSITLGANRA